MPNLTINIPTAEVSRVVTAMNAEYEDEVQDGESQNAFALRKSKELCIAKIKRVVIGHEDKHRPPKTIDIT